MVENLIVQGAEAHVFKGKKWIIKERKSKSYRIPQLDDKLIKQRTKKEAKLLEKASKIINVPKVANTTHDTIVMQEIKGKKLAKFLDKLPNKNKIAKEIGQTIAKIHDWGIIHGDLTTSNMIYSKNKLYLIDFGLGFESDNIEDKAVDLHVLKEALEARHNKFAKKLFNCILTGYKLSKNYKTTITRLENVEKRGRYKSAY